MPPHSPLSQELVLFSPTNFVYHCKLAEIYYSMGGLDNLRLARKHYAQSLEVHGEENLRALYGLTTVSEHFTGSRAACGVRRLPLGASCFSPISCPSSDVLRHRLGSSEGQGRWQRQRGAFQARGRPLEGSLRQIQQGAPINR